MLVDQQVDDISQHLLRGYHSDYTEHSKSSTPPDLNQAESRWICAWSDFDSGGLDVCSSMGDHFSRRIQDCYKRFAIELVKRFIKHDLVIDMFRSGIGIIRIDGLL